MLSDTYRNMPDRTTTPVPHTAQSPRISGSLRDNVLNVLDRDAMESAEEGPRLACDLHGSDLDCQIAPADCGVPGKKWVACSSHLWAQKEMLKSVDGRHPSE
ncbi:hypothetical protein BaRGS_00000258 [Batillaria attramentaria]|uniref:Uncharacterized protein n=1 Tax=Batillaria attramentaria TaxID=370345 RepID=A0ABD0MC48_9CAEN